MTTLLSVIAVGLTVIAIIVMVMNWGYVIVSLRNKMKGNAQRYSTVPLVSIVMTAIAFEICPAKDCGWIGIIPASDIGNWLLLGQLIKSVKWGETSSQM